LCQAAACLITQRRESSKRNYCIISPRVIIKAIIDISSTQPYPTSPILHPFSLSQKDPPAGVQTADLSYYQSIFSWLCCDIAVDVK